MTEKIVYLMRGLPSCGKSTTARKLAGETGVVCETDEYFYTQVGDDPARFDYREGLMEEARRWNFDRFRRAIDEGITPVVVDRGNSRSTESKTYARYALDHGYKVELREPESEWWQEIRVLLKYKKLTKPALYEWADRLAAMNRDTHRVPATTIKRWMDKWRWDLTVDDILNYEPRESVITPSAAAAAAPAAAADSAAGTDSEPEPEPQTESYSPLPAGDATAPTDDPLAAAAPDDSPSNPEDLLPTEDELLLQDSPLKPGERSPFL
jgi:hypothetical protein